MKTELIGVTRNLALALCLAAAPAGAAAAQEERKEITDLQQRIVALESALDSLQSTYETRIAALEEKLVAIGEVEPAAQVSESALDAEERASLEAELAGILGGNEGRGAGSVTAVGQEELAPTPERRFTGQSRNLNKLNPEISVTGDTFLELSDDSGNPERNQFRIAEFEMAFQAPLDPFSLAKAFVVFEEGEFALEEAFIDWTALPAGLGLKFGAFRNDFGKLNRWHQHALPQSARPLVHQSFFGEEGLRGTGVGLSWLPGAVLGDYNELWLQVTNDENDVSFSGGVSMSRSSHFTRQIIGTSRRRLIWKLGSPHRPGSTTSLATSGRGSWGPTGTWRGTHRPRLCIRVSSCAESFSGRGVRRRSGGRIVSVLTPSRPTS